MLQQGAHRTLRPMPTTLEDALLSADPLALVRAGGTAVLGAGDSSLPLASSYGRVQGLCN